MSGWVVVGLTGQALFTARSTLQWVSSERAARVRIPWGYWELSLLGGVLLLCYAMRLGDPVFLASPLVSVWVSGRNLALSRGDGTPREPAWWELWGVGALLVCGVAASGAGAEASWWSPWVAVGIVGQTLWLLRFPLQWHCSERAGCSVLPPVFWWVSLVGSVLLCAYALWRRDVVFVLAYALNPIPCARNLVLARRQEACG